jgi:hypothetical protein
MAAGERLDDGRKQGGQLAAEKKRTTGKRAPAADPVEVIGRLGSGRCSFSSNGGCA